MKIVIPSGSGGHSGYGISFWLSYLKCRRRTRLSDKYGGDSSEPATIGTLFHKLLEEYYNGNLENRNVVIEHQDGENPEFTEALRIFQEYRARFPSSCFGRVEGAEMALEVSGQEALDLFGVPRLTARCDLVVYVDELAVRTIKATRNLTLEPGYYIVDAKTKKAKSKDFAIFFNNSLQFYAYQMMWNHLYPDKPIKGMIADIVVRHKKMTDDSFMCHLVGPPTPQQMDVVFSTLSQCYAIRQSQGEDFCNITQCFAFTGGCPHLLTGVCDRISRWQEPEEL